MKLNALYNAIPQLPQLKNGIGCSENMDQRDIPPEIDEYGTAGLEIRQVQWAWLWSSMPWLIAVIVLYYTQWIPLDEFTTSILFAIILIPRFLIWRRTKYTLTESTLFYGRGGILSSKTIPLPLWRIKDVKSRFGMFGRQLGHQSVDILMDNDATARLAYVPINRNVEIEVRRRMEEAERPIESTSEDEPTLED